MQHEIADVRSTPTGQTLWPVPEAQPCVTANLPGVRRNLHAPPSVTLLARSQWKRAPSQYYAAGSEPSRVLATQGVDQSAVPRLRLYRSLPLLLIGRLSNRHSHRGLIVTGCLAGIAYYLGLAFASGPIMLIGLQLLNAWSFAGIAGIGLPLFQEMIPRPGLSTGLYMNTRRIGAIVSGPIIAIGSLTVLGQHGIFLTSAVLTLIGLAIIAIADRTTTKPTKSDQLPALT